MNDTDSATFQLRPGRAPLIVSMPHVGTRVPEEIEHGFTPVARALADTDWYVDRLYDFVPELGASVIAARYSRYVIDLNRPPNDAALYPGMTSTGLCPTHSFAGEPLYGSGVDLLPAGEIDFRRQRYWQPYHDALAGVIADTRRRLGFALLLDAHSIRSRVPRLYTGRLPDINIGTADGGSCHPDLMLPLLEILAAQSQFSYVVNGRFKGGHITRHYGSPADGVHALQIELAQVCYMDEDRVSYDEARAAPLRELLQRLLAALSQFAPAKASR
ncbi:MAG TPA: N-formylglutamate deformylase [Steroidobacteraceae bacterium]|jgi:N-formylglutamate deformylase|nr:N-formylglutamate deformylase [Steroidobacteraceae bacterium]